jgi:predicted dehydrogenase
MTDRFDVTRICDLSAEVAAHIGSELCVAHSTEAADVINDPEVDAVMVCTPGAHSTLARQALEAGKHVFAEKPYAYDPDTAECDARFAAEHGLVLQVGYMKVFEPAVGAARAVLDRIGRVRRVRMTVLHPCDERQTKDLVVLRGSDVDAERLACSRRENQSEVGSALKGHPGVDPVLFRNVLHGSVCHQVAVLRALFPDAATSVDIVLQDAPGSKRSEPPRLEILGRLGDTAMWNIDWNWLTDYPEYREWAEIWGDRGSITIDFPAPYAPNVSAVATMRVTTEMGVRTEVIEPIGPSAFARELRAFAHSVLDGAPVECDALAAARDARVLRDIAERVRP